MRGVLFTVGQDDEQYLPLNFLEAFHGEADRVVKRSSSGGKIITIIQLGNIREFPPLDIQANADIAVSEPF